MTTTRRERDDDVTRPLAETLASTTVADLSTPVRDHVYRAVVDWLGSAIGGAVEPPARAIQEVVAGLGDSQECTVFGAGRSSAAGAALANGVAAHALELDDIHKGSTVHAAAPIISAAYAVAEREHASGVRFMTAVALGYEAALRIGEAVNPTHYEFWHPTGTVATFGAAAASGWLIDLTPLQMVHALGSAGTQAAGLWEFNADGAMSKVLHPGKAAFNGILAADLARRGFTGATRIVEGSRGFVRAMSRSSDMSRVTDGLRREWKIAENCYKLHACCGHTHSAIDIALRFRRDPRWPAVDPTRHIASIEIETYGPGYAIVREPNPRTPYQAKFSIAYCVAAAALEGRVFLDQFSPDRFDTTGVRDTSIRALLERTRVVVADDLSSRYPAAWPARVSVHLTDGTVLNGERDYPEGNPEDPVSTRSLEDKARCLIALRCGSTVADETLRAVQRVADCPDIAALLPQVFPRATSSE